MPVAETSTPHDTPIGALLAHLEAFSARDNARFREAVSTPFCHLWPDGDLWVCSNESELDIAQQYAKGGIDPEKFGWTSLDDATLVLDWDGLKAFRVRFTRYGRDGGRLGRSEAIWAVTRAEAGWKMKLRIGAARTN